MVRPSGDHIGWRASLKTSVMRVIAPPPDGMVQMLPCMSVAMVRPSGEIATDIEVPSRTVTSISDGLAGTAAAARRAGAGRGCEPCWAARPTAIKTITIATRWRVMRRILQACGLAGYRLQ